MAIDLLGKSKKASAGGEASAAPPEAASSSAKKSANQSVTDLKNKLSGISSKLGLDAKLKKKVGKTAVVPENGSKPALNPKALKGYLKSNLSDGVKAFPRGVTEMTLRTDLENGKSLFWRLTDTSLEQITSEEPTGLIASFGANDFRIACEPKDSYSKISNMLNVEADAKTYPINRIKDQLAAYGTAVTRIMESTGRIGPGQQALEALVAEKLTDEEKENPVVMVYGAVLKDSSSGTSLTILFSKDTLGGTSRPQIVINSDNPEFVLNQFLTSKKIPKNNAKVYWFSNSELLSKAYEVHLYPNEPVFQGIAIRKLLWLGVIASAVGAIGGGGWFSIEIARNQILKVTATNASENTKKLIDANSQAIAGSLTSFGKIMAIDLNKGLELVNTTYLRGTKATLSSDSTGFNILLKIEMKNDLGVAATGNSTFKFRESADLKALLDFTPPEGCTKNELITNGDINEAELAINCPVSDTRLSGYRSQ